MDEKEKKEIEKIFKHHIGILSEDFQEKLDIVAEGHKMLTEKIDRMGLSLDKVEEGLERVETKVDAVASNLAAHRADTESHRRIYRAKETKA